MEINFKALNIRHDALKLSEEGVCLSFPTQMPALNQITSTRKEVNTGQMGLVRLLYGKANCQSSAEAAHSV